MSRVGKKPIEIPSGVKASVDGSVVKIEGSKGKLEYPLTKGVSAAVEGSTLTLACDTPEAMANFGTARANINNMVLGVTTGWKKALEMQGVGFSANLTGSKLKIVCGYSHDVFLEVPKAVTCKAEKTSIQLESIDKQVLGNFAASIRKVCPPEPYLGKGIRYSDEVVRRKAGKTGKK